MQDILIDFAFWLVGFVGLSAVYVVGVHYAVKKFSRRRKRSTN